MGSARDVIAACLADHWNRPEQWTGEQYADAVLAALREHWTSEGQVNRVWFVVREDSWTVPNEIRAVINALFEG